jgi:hypothetical protein
MKHFFASDFVSQHSGFISRFHRVLGGGCPASATASLLDDLRWLHERRRTLAPYLPRCYSHKPLPCQQRAYRILALFLSFCSRTLGCNLYPTAAHSNAVNCNCRTAAAQRRAEQLNAALRCINSVILGCGLLYSSQNLARTAANAAAMGERVTIRSDEQHAEKAKQINVNASQHPSRNCFWRGKANSELHKASHKSTSRHSGEHAASAGTCSSSLSGW